MKTFLALLGLAACGLAAWGLNQLLDLLPVAHDNLTSLVLSLVLVALVIGLVRGVVFFVKLLFEP